MKILLLYMWLRYTNSEEFVGEIELNNRWGEEK